MTAGILSLLLTVSFSCDTAWVVPLAPMVPGASAHWTVTRTEHGHTIADARKSIFIGDSGSAMQVRSWEAMPWAGPYMPAIARDRWGYKDEVVFARMGGRIVGIRAEGRVAEPDAIYREVEDWIGLIRSGAPPDLGSIASATIRTDSSFMPGEGLLIAASLRTLSRDLGAATVTVDLAGGAGITRAVAIGTDGAGGAPRIQNVTVKFGTRPGTDTDVNIIEEPAPPGSSTFLVHTERWRIRVETVPAVTSESVTEWLESFRRILSR